MTALFLLVASIGITWLCWWAKDEAPTPPGKWCVFDFDEVEPETPPDGAHAPPRRLTPARAAPSGRAAASRIAGDRALSERPLGERALGERPWKRSGS